MNTGKRLQDLRTTRDLSQGDIQKRTGLLCSYILRVENGYTVPSFETLEQLARALGIEMYQFLFESKGEPVPVSLARADGISKEETKLLGHFRSMNESDRSLVTHVARDLVARVKK